MIDPHLQKVLSEYNDGKKEVISSTASLLPKSRYEIALDAAIQAQADLLMSEADPAENKLVPAAVKRAKLEKELQEALDLSELDRQMDKALKLLFGEGEKYLAAPAFQELIDHFSKAKSRLAALNLDVVKEEKLYVILGLSEGDLASIYTMGIAKFNEGLLHDSFALFSLLSALDEQQPDYWFRLGAIAQNLDDYEFALRAYAAAIYFAPDHLAARLLSAECYVKIGQIDDAKAEYEEAKRIEPSSKTELPWQEQMKNIEFLITNARPNEKGELYEFRTNK